MLAENSRREATINVLADDVLSVSTQQMRINDFENYRLSVIRRDEGNYTAFKAKWFKRDQTLNAVLCYVSVFSFFTGRGIVLSFMQCYFIFVEISQIRCLT